MNHDTVSFILYEDLDDHTELKSSWENQKVRQKTVISDRLNIHECDCTAYLTADLPKKTCTKIFHIRKRFHSHKISHSNAEKRTF